MKKTVDRLEEHIVEIKQKLLKTRKRLGAVAECNG